MRHKASFHPHLQYVHFSTTFIMMFCTSAAHTIKIIHHALEILKNDHWL